MLFNLSSKTQFGHICRLIKVCVKFFISSQSRLISCLYIRRKHLRAVVKNMWEIKLLDISSKTHPQLQVFTLLRTEINKFLVSTKMFRSSSYQKYAKSSGKDISCRCTLCTFASDYKSKLKFFTSLSTSLVSCLFVRMITFIWCKL